MTRSAEELRIGKRLGRSWRPSMLVSAGMVGSKCCSIVDTPANELFEYSRPLTKRINEHGVRVRAGDEFYFISTDAGVRLTRRVPQYRRGLSRGL